MLSEAEWPWGTKIEERKKKREREREKRREKRKGREKWGQRPGRMSESERSTWILSIVTCQIQRGRKRNKCEKKKIFFFFYDSPFFEKIIELLWILLKFYFKFYLNLKNFYYYFISNFFSIYLNFLFSSFSRPRPLVEPWPPLWTFLAKPFGEHVIAPVLRMFVLCCFFTQTWTWTGPTLNAMTSRHFTLLAHVATPSCSLNFWGTQRSMWTVWTRMTWPLSCSAARWDVSNRLRSCWRTTELMSLWSPHEAPLGCGLRAVLASLELSWPSLPVGATSTWQ